MSMSARWATEPVTAFDPCCGVTQNQWKSLNKLIKGILIILLLQASTVFIDMILFIRIYHGFVQGQGNPPECQRFAVHDEACRVVDVANLWHEGGFPCLCTKPWLIIFLLPLLILITKPHFSLSKTTSKRFLLRKRRQLGLIMMSHHCMIYDVTRCSLKRSCLYRGR